VLDLVQHHFEEARELYADRWLGFSESALAGDARIRRFHPDRNHRRRPRTRRMAAPFPNPAGHRARSEDRDVFAVDEKEIREHEYVAQSLVAKLLDLGQLERRSREILDLGSIVHFLTLIQVDLDTPMTTSELLRRLHPTPALGPLPRTDATMERLLEWRGRLGCPPEFGAPFGLWDHGRFDAVVAIRGIWWQDHSLSIPAGCGIIEASRLVNEWRELRLKREAVKRFLGCETRA
jgi:menaquinone-specific isochorismate synthase